MNEWTYEPMHQSLRERITLFPREKDMMFSVLRTLWNLLLRAFLKVYFRLSITGKDHLPLQKSFVLIANHSSHLDAISLSCALPWRSIHATFSVAAKDYFFSNFFKSFFSGIFINAIPFDRKKSPKASLELCADALNVSGNALILFPEGTRSSDGEIHPFKSGLGHLVAGTERLVVPAYIDGAHEAWPKGSHFPRPKKIKIRIGAPLSFLHMPQTKEGYQEVAKVVQHQVEELKNIEEGKG